MSEPDAGETAFAMAHQLAEVDAELVATRPYFAIKKGWVLTLDEKPPAGVHAVRPLPDKEYLEAVTELWIQSPRLLLCKSRQMMISWLFAWLTEWEAAFNPYRHCVIQGKRLDDVDASNPHRMLGRVRFIRNHLPPWMRPVLADEQNTKSESYTNGSTIEAIPEGEDIVRSKVPSAMWLDELAFQPTGEKNWNAANPAAARMYGVTTPNGHEFVYRQGDAERLWDDWRDWPELIRGLHTYRNKQGIQLAFLHYTADPNRRTIEYQREKRAGYTNARDYMREMEGDFRLSAGLGVYANEFDPSRHVIEHYRVNPKAPIYRGWDTGYTGQAVSFFQHNNDGQLVWFDQIIQKAVPLPAIANEAKARWLRHLHELAAPQGTMVIGMDAAVATSITGTVIDYGDPHCEAHNTNGETDVATLSKFGIRLLTKSSTGRKRDLVEQVRGLLLDRSDGKPALIVAKNTPEMNHVIAGLAGGYHYAEPKEGKAEKEVPHKDGFYDHVFDSAQYAIDHISPIRFTGPPDVPDTTEVEPGIGSDAFYRWD